MKYFLVLVLLLLVGCAPGAMGSLFGQDDRPPIERRANAVGSAVHFRNMRRINQLFTPAPFSREAVQRHEQITRDCGTTRSLDMTHQIDGNRAIFTLVDDRNVFGQASAEWLEASETFASNARIDALLNQAYRLTLDCRRF